MQASSQAVTPTPPAEVLDDRQLHRLGTVHLVMARLSTCGGRAFGVEGEPATLEFRPDGRFHYHPGHPKATPLMIEGPVRGVERMIPGFRGNYPEQRLVRSLVTFIREGRRVDAANLAQALMSIAGTYFKQVEASYTAVMQEFRFAGVFNKPVHIDPKQGPRPTA